MKTAIEWLDENGYGNTELWSRQGVYEVAIRLQHAHDKEWTQKIQTALDKTSNWNCKEVLTKLLEDK